MAPSNATFGIDIVADDKTAKGRRAAEKSLGTIPKHVSAVNKRYADEADKSIRRTSGSLVRTFGAVEKASARAFGGTSLTSGLSGRLGAIREAAAAAGTGMGQAATAGGALESAMGGVGVAAGATVGVLAAAGYAAFKLADGWAKGAASIGRTADIIGIASKQLQEFNAAAERQGVDKNTAAGAVAGLSQSLNDARYGRNNDAVALLSRLGVKLQLNKDGTVNTGAMLPAIADALARQNSSGRRTAAHILGIPDAALPAFTQGGAALSADMKDADKTANVRTPGEIDAAKRFQKKEVLAKQMGDKALDAGGHAVATAGGGLLDAAVDAGRGVIAATSALTGFVKESVAPVAKKSGNSVVQPSAVPKAAAPAVIKPTVTGGAQSGIPPDIIQAAQTAERKWGIPASVTLAQYALESGNGRHMPAGSNNPFGIKARSGDPYVIARTREEDRHGRSYYIDARFRKFDSIEEAFDAHAKLLAGSNYAKARQSLPAGVDAFADALTGVYATDHAYGSKLRNVIHRGGLDRYDQLPEIPLKVEVQLVNAPPGTKARVRAGRGKPAISQAMQH